MLWTTSNWEAPILYFCIVAAASFLQLHPILSGAHRMGCKYLHHLVLQNCDSGDRSTNVIFRTQKYQVDTSNVRSTEQRLAMFVSGIKRKYLMYVLIYSAVALFWMNEPISRFIHHLPQKSAYIHDAVVCIGTLDLQFNFEPFACNLSIRDISFHYSKLSKWRV